METTLKHINDYKGAGDFFENNLPVWKLKKIFDVSDDDLKKWSQSDEQTGEKIDFKEIDEIDFFNYLNDNGYCDEEAIIQALKYMEKEENKEYWLNCVQTNQEFYFELYEIINPYKKAYNILMNYWDSLPDEEKEAIDKELKKLNL